MTDAFKDRLRFHCREVGWTQAMLAGFIGVAPSTLSKYVNGARPWPPGLLRQAGEKLGLDHEQIQELADLLPGPSERPVVSKGNLSIGNLPAALTPFVDRARELVALGRLLADSAVRLVTVVGPGGCGKTRLALEAAAAQVDRYSHGAWFISLASLDVREGIVPTIAQAIGFPLDGAREPRQQLFDYVRQKQTFLLIDNCEPLPAAGALLADLLRAAPGVRVLATSRARLGLQGETAFELAGMSCPPEGERSCARLSSYSAAALFLSMARRVRPGWTPQGEECVHVTRICRQVEGMPLALLLAAAWIDTLSVAEIARRVACDLDFLEAEWPDVPARQRSMRAVFDGSWRLLTEREQAVFAALAVFRDGFTAQAAQQVGQADALTLRALVHKSFLQVNRQRYEVHELLRQYAQEKLDPFPDVGRDARERHSAYYFDLFEGWAAEPKGAAQRAMLGEMEAEQGNLQAAWEWAVEQGRWQEVEQVAEALARFYDWRGRVEEARRLFSRAAERLSALVAEGTVASPVEIHVLVELLAWHGRFEANDAIRVRLARRCQELLDNPALAGQDTRRQRALVLRVFPHELAGGDAVRARALLQESLSLYRSLDDRWAGAVVLLGLGKLEYSDGKLLISGQLLEESLALFRALGDQRGIASCLYTLHLAYGWQGQFEEAERVVQERMVLAREWGDLASLAQAYRMLASIRYIAGHFVEAVKVLERELLPRLEELGDRLQWTWCNAWWGHAKLDGGDYRAGRAIAERSLALGREMNSKWAICAALPVLAMQALLEDRPEEACQFYEKALAAADEVGDHVFTLYYGGEWAAAELFLGRREKARQCLRSALRSALGTQSGRMPIKVLPSAALWLAAEGQAERAVEVYALALRYPHVANSHWVQDVFGPPIAESAASLSPEIAQTARERGQARDLQATVQGLLAELEP